MVASIYAAYVNRLAIGEVKITTDVYKAMLVSSTYTPNADTDANPNAISTHEVSGAGYTAGGKALDNTSWTYSAADNTWTFDADNPSWTEATLSDIKHVVIWDTNVPILAGYYTYDEAQTVEDGTFIVSWSPSGIFGAQI